MYILFSIGFILRIPCYDQPDSDGLFEDNEWWVTDDTHTGLLSENDRETTEEI